MFTTNMTINALVSNNSALTTIVEALAKGTSYQHTLDGALGIITKYWNKGYGDCAKGLGFNTPSELGKFMRLCKRSAEAGTACDGMDSRMIFVSEPDDNGNVKTALGTWGTKRLDDESVTITDKKGKECHPYLMVGETCVEIDNCKAMTNVTPSTIFTFIIQNQELLAGNVTPQTDLETAKTIAAQVEKERIENKNKKGAKKTAKSNVPTTAKSNVPTTAPKAKTAPLALAI